MTISRRSFLGGALALTAASAVPASALRALGAVPVIYGDGIHDDTDGLQAAIDGKPFRVAGEDAYVLSKGGRVFFSSGTFRLSRTLHIRNKAYIRGGRFVGSEIKNGTVLHVHTGGLHTTVADMHIVGNPGIHGITFE